MNSKTSLFQSDFDKLAYYDIDGWDHNCHYHPYLLRHVAEDCNLVLEIGCGTGSFSRLLSEKADHVLAVDLSLEMIKIAKKRSAEYSNITYQVADVMTWDFPQESFDCIASIATLHHLPFENILQKMKSGLKPGGKLLILDLYQAEGLIDFLPNLLAIPVDTVLKLVNTRRLREPKEACEAWAEHGKHESYLPVSTVRRICNDRLPGAVVKKHLLWRYSVVWQKTKLM